MKKSDLVVIALEALSEKLSAWVKENGVNLGAYELTLGEIDFLYSDKKITWSQRAELINFYLVWNKIESIK